MIHRDEQRRRTISAPQSSTDRPGWGGELPRLSHTQPRKIKVVLSTRRLFDSGQRAYITGRLPYSSGGDSPIERHQLPPRVLATVEGYDKGRGEVLPFFAENKTRSGDDEIATSLAESWQIRAIKEPTGTFCPELFASVITRGAASSLRRRVISSETSRLRAFFFTGSYTATTADPAVAFGCQLS